MQARVLIIPIPLCKDTRATKVTQNMPHHCMGGGGGDTDKGLDS